MSNPIQFLDPAMHRTGVMGKLVYEVSLSHEDGWIADGATMRQSDKDQVKYVELFTAIIYPTPSSRAE